MLRRAAAGKAAGLLPVPAERADARAVVPFGHPRNLITLAADAGFGRLKLDIWRVLEEEVTRTRAEMEQ